MKRFLCAIVLSVVLAACGDNQLPSPHRVGAVNSATSPPCETLTLGTGTIHSITRLTTNVDTLSVNIVNLTGTGNGTYTFEGSNDNTNWFTITLPVVPPVLVAGAPTPIPIAYEGGWPWGYFRVTYVGTSSSGTASLCEVLKG